MRCENCGIEVENITDNCPLCGNHLNVSNKEESDKYPKLKNSPKKKDCKGCLWLMFGDKKIKNDAK